jgi:heme/copper-type cytochrome/quinol oxidase subunit 2
VRAVRRQVLVTLLVLAAAALVAGLYFAFRPASDTTAPPATTAGTTEQTTTEVEVVPTVPVTQLRVTVRAGKPVGGIQHVVAPQGGPVVVSVRSDVADEVHVHGYDLSRDVAPGEPAVIRFEATIPGRFEIELEDRGVPIGELEVRP